MVKVYTDRKLCLCVRMRVCVYKYGSLIQWMYWTIHQLCDVVSINVKVGTVLTFLLSLGYFFLSRGSLEGTIYRIKTQQSSFSFIKDKREGRKTHKQSPTEGGCSEGLAKHL